MAVADQDLSLANSNLAPFLYKSAEHLQQVVAEAKGIVSAALAG